MGDKTRGHKTKKCKSYFKSDDYLSGSGMITTIWGPTLWHFLHTISFNYPVEPSSSQKKYYKNFIVSLENILPCKYCRENLKKNLKTLPITNKVLENRDTFSRYIFDLHELINKMLDKKSNLSYEEVRERYEHFRSRCLPNKKTIKKLITKKKKKKEKGCIHPLHGSKKNKCILQIVPKTSKATSFEKINQ